MFWTQSRTVRRALLLPLLLFGLTVSSSAFAAGRGAGNRGENQRATNDRSAAARDSKDKTEVRREEPKGRSESPRVDVKRPEAPANGNSRVAPQPVQGRAPAAPVQGRAPVAPVQSRGPAVGNRWSDQQPRTFSTPASPVTQRPTERPAQATPYRLYDTGPSNVRATPEAGRPAYRPSPVSSNAGNERRATPYRTPVATDGGKQPTPSAAPVRERPARGGEMRAVPSNPDARQRPPAPERAQRPTTPSPGQRDSDRALKVPEAQFRGPDTTPRVIRQQEQPRVQERLRSRLQEQNRQRDQERVRPKFDTVGNTIPGDATVIRRDGVSRLSVGFGRIQRDFGAPKHSFVVAPRSRADYWDGYWDGYTDGYWAGKHHRHHGGHVVISFYYGFYFSDPYWFAFYYPGYYPAVYHYWGWSPGWVYPTRVYYAPTEYVYVPATPYRYYYSGYSLDEAGAYRTIEDVRQAWFESQISKLAYHLTDQEDIRIYFDGAYEYSTSTDDYYAMTVDAMATTNTVAMDFDTPIWLSTNEFFVTGRHVFYDPNDERQTVYVSYRFRKLGGEWFLVAVGSSLNPIQHEYHDFRF